jgi:hypothetical protein
VVLLHFNEFNLKHVNTKTLAIHIRITPKPTPQHFQIPLKVAVTVHTILETGCRSAAADKPEPEVDYWLHSFPCNDATHSIKKFRYEIYARNRHHKRYPFNPIQGEPNPF